MYRNIILATFGLLLILFTSCKEIPTKSILPNYTRIETTLLFDTADFSTRAITASKDGLYFVGSSGKAGFIDFDGTVSMYPTIEEEISFRAIALNGKNGVPHILSIAYPALLYRYNSTTKEWELVYEEYFMDVFYDSMKFWNENEGIAFGDKLGGEDCMSVLITRDGGNSWQKLDCDNFIKSETEKEGAFAASNSNIAIVGDNAWLAAGTRIFHTPDKGKTWRVTNPPVIQDDSSDGIYSIDFYDELNGVAIGGNYSKPEQNINNILQTKDGGKTWQVISNENSLGYRSQIKYLPNRNAHSFIAVGFNGVDVTYDNGKTWHNLTQDGFYTIDFLANQTNRGYLGGQNGIHYFELH